MEFNSLTDVLVDELGDLYSAEQQLVDALPKMAAAAHSYELRDALEAHAAETTQQVGRLDRAFSEMGIRFSPTRTSEPMKGLVEEAEHVITAGGDSVALDAALIGVAQRIEHYEIGAYGTARALAGELQLGETKDMLDQTLDEENKANKVLAKLATGGMMSSGINRIAAERSAEPVEEPRQAEEANAEASEGVVT
jgi:ferritin-like metal-binding protein YciE